MKRHLNPEPREPQTSEEWQHAVDAAAGLRMIADCQMYGLVKGGPRIRVQRCDEILERGAKRGIRPSMPDKDLALGFVREFNAGMEAS